MKKKILLILLTIFVLLQLIPRPAKNIADGTSKNDISSLYTVPANVQQVLSESCNDCHSNNTKYPWYSKIQPVAWWLGQHIKDGKNHLNFSEFAGYSLRKQYHKLEEVEEMVQQGEMPLSSYTIIHTKAKLSSDQKALLVEWTKSLRTAMEAKYPIDSLVKPKS